MSSTYYLKHRERILAYRKYLRDTFPEMIKEQKEKSRRKHYAKEAEKARERYSKSQLEILDKARQKYHGVTKEQYQLLVNKQNNLCAICKEPETGKDHRSGKIKALAIDHNHQTSRIRGLLCNGCNRALGYFRDSYLFLLNAVDYLEEDIRMTKTELQVLESAGENPHKTKRETPPGTVPVKV